MKALLTHCYPSPPVTLEFMEMLPFLYLKKAVEEDERTEGFKCLSQRWTLNYKMFQDIYDITLYDLGSSLLPNL
jgi:hypothetical protein